VASDISRWHAGKLILSAFSWNKSHLYLHIHPKSLFTTCLYSFPRSSDTTWVPMSPTRWDIKDLFSNTRSYYCQHFLAMGNGHFKPKLVPGVWSTWLSLGASPSRVSSSPQTAMVTTQHIKAALSLFLTHLYFCTHFFLSPVIKERKCFNHLWTSDPVWKEMLSLACLLNISH